MERNVDNEEFISDIQKRPGIWNSNLRQYTDKSVRAKLWKEIVTKYGGDLTYKEKQLLLQQLQKKWKNIRDSFLKYIKHEEDVKKGSAVPKKSYIYYKQLQFLKKIPQLTAQAHIDNQEEDSSNQGLCDEQRLSTPRPGNSRQSERQQRFTRKRKLVNGIEKTQNDFYRKEMLNMLQKNIKMKEEFDISTDPDRLFIMSLVDEFKKVPEDLKMALKIELLSSIQNAQTYDSYRRSIASDNSQNNRWDDNSNHYEPASKLNVTSNVEEVVPVKLERMSTNSRRSSSEHSENLAEKGNS